MPSALSRLCRRLQLKGSLFSPAHCPPAEGTFCQTRRYPGMSVGWRHTAIVLALVAIALLAVAVATPAIERRLAFGTFSTEGPPPRIDYCGRRYYPDSNFPNSAHRSGSAVAAELSANGPTGLTRIGTTPSGMPISANIMTRAQRASLHTSVCTMGVWVQVGPDRYLAYGLSGGP
jgi:hypothetical protein